MVREYAGYDRLEGLEEQTLLAAGCKPLVPLLNFFIPSEKLKSKTRVGSKEIKVYDNPQSPFQRLIKCAELPQVYKDTLKAQCSHYNPVELQQNV
ncbi:MAG: transposase, partial [Treponema sp.]|nr:transposase [Treponema sp.]